MNLHPYFTWFFLSFTLFYVGSKEIIPIKQHDTSSLKSGDIVFQSSDNGQDEAIRIATGSRFSHCGVIEVTEKGVFVIEAVQPVKITEFNRWTKRNDSCYYEVKRLKDTIPLEPLHETLKWAKKQVGKNYDSHFMWTDDRMYCSELVYKAYLHGANITLCKTNPLKSYSTNHPLVRTTMEQRYGKNIPWDEPMVSPQDLYESPLLYSLPLSKVRCR